MKSIEMINDSIKRGKAKVFTASEIKEMVRNGKIPTVDEVDVVTCGTFGIMSGTMAILSVPVSDPGSFRRADTITLNGVPGIPGPCPNEGLGLVDCVVYGTSRRDEGYGGGHLFKDMVDGVGIDVKVTSEGKEFTKELKLKDMPFARMIVTRGAFRNYTAFFNPLDGRFKTIFSVTGMNGPSKECSVSGCGEINPIQNDPSMKALKEGSNILLNGARGVIMGTGTRSSETRPNLSAFADMKGMDGNMMGGFITSEGPECMTSFATAIPITDDDSLRSTFVLDEEIEIPIADVQTRIPKSEGTYDSVWRNTSKKISVNRKNCVNCKHCNAESKCPVNAIDDVKINGACVVCGACVRTCVGKVFSADLGELEINASRLPITLRQSDRNRAEMLSIDLKKTIEKGNWEFRM